MEENLFLLEGEGEGWCQLQGLIKLSDDRFFLALLTNQIAGKRVHISCHIMMICTGVVNGFKALLLTQ